MNARFTILSITGWFKASTMCPSILSESKSRSLVQRFKPFDETLIGFMEVPTFNQGDTVAIFRTRNGFVHSDSSSYDHPAIITPTKMEWLKYNTYHRDDDLPARVWSNGSKEWWFDGYIHRGSINGIDQPAWVECEGSNQYMTLSWWQWAECHRNSIDGIEQPADVCPSSGRLGWYKNRLPCNVTVDGVGKPYVLG